MKKSVIFFTVSILIAVLVLILTVKFEFTYNDFDLIPDNYVAVFVWDDFIKYNERYNSKVVAKLFYGNEFKQFFNKNIVSVKVIDSYVRLINFYKGVYDKFSVFFHINPKLTFSVIDNVYNHDNKYEYLAIVDIENDRKIGNFKADGIFEIVKLYRNYIIYSVDFDNKFYFTFINNKIVVGSSELIISKCIDKSLLNKINLRLMSDELSGNNKLKLFFNKEFNFSCWLSGEYLKFLDENASIYSFMDRNAPVYSFNLRHCLTSTDNYIDANFVTSSEHSIKRNRNNFARFAENTLNRNNMVFLWTDTFNMADFLSIFNDIFDKLFDSDSLKEKYLNICSNDECNEIIKSFGKEFCLLINGNSVPNQYDNSVGCLVFEIIDSKIVLNFIKKFLNGIQTVTVKAGDLDIASLNLAGGLLRPSYCFKGKYLFIADNAELIENAWNNYYSPNGRFDMIAGDGNYSMNNFFVYSRVSELSNRLYPLINLFVKDNGEWSSILDQQSRSSLRGVGLPLLTALRNVDNGCLRISTSPYAINFHISYSLKNN